MKGLNDRTIRAVACLLIALGVALGIVALTRHTEAAPEAVPALQAVPTDTVAVPQQPKDKHRRGEGRKRRAKKPSTRKAAPRPQASPLDRPVSPL